MLEDKRLKMQEYFLPNELNVYKEEIQLIFQLRCQVIKLKINLKGLYDTYECAVCMDEDESQTSKWSYMRKYQSLKCSQEGTR